MNYEKQEAIIKMYLEENLTADQISDETGYSVSTIKKTISANHVSKRSANVSKEDEKPYTKITDNIVEYKGKRYVIMDPDELRDELYDTLCRN